MFVLCCNFFINLELYMYSFIKVYPTIISSQYLSSILTHFPLILLAVMYMGSMPYFPTLANAQQQWPFGPTPTLRTETTPKTEQTQFPFPSTSAAYPQSAFTKFPTSGDDFRAPSAPCKTTNAISKEYSTSFKVCRSF